jgi:hypothetical protein
MGRPPSLDLTGGRTNVERRRYLAELGLRLEDLPETMAEVFYLFKKATTVKTLRFRWERKRWRFTKTGSGLPYET